jgi:hypothetical protein
MGFFNILLFVFILERGRTCGFSFFYFFIICKFFGYFCLLLKREGGHGFFSLFFICFYF